MGRVVAEAGIIGFFGYGVNLVLFVLGLRHLGATRSGAYFSTAPFIGALLRLATFHEPVTARPVIEGGLMAARLYLHLAEAHEHAQVRDGLEHDHAPVHDSHHGHSLAQTTPKASRIVTSIAMRR